MYNMETWLGASDVFLGNYETIILLTDTCLKLLPDMTINWDNANGELRVKDPVMLNMDIDYLFCGN